MEPRIQHLWGKMMEVHYCSHCQGKANSSTFCLIGICHINFQLIWLLRTSYQIGQFALKRQYYEITCNWNWIYNNPLFSEISLLHKTYRQDKWESLPLHLSFFFLTDGADLWNFPEGCYIFSVMCGVIPRLPLGTSDLNSKLCFMGQRTTGVLLLRIGRKTTEWVHRPLDLDFTTN